MKRKNYIIVLLIVLSKTLTGQSCTLLDSLFSKHEKFFFGKIHGDSFIKTSKSEVPMGQILKAANLLNLTTKNRFYLINRYLIDKKRKKMSFYVEEFIKEKQRPLEGYAFTDCPYFLKCMNIAYFKIEKGEIIFEKWFDR